MIKSAQKSKNASPGFSLLENVLPAPKILLVDDKEKHLNDIERALRDPGTTIGRLNCEIFKVETVADARAYLKKDLIDLYVLDLEIAEEEGQGINEEVGMSFVRDVVNATNAGVIVCSAFYHHAPELLEYGADDFIAKPINHNLARDKKVARSRSPIDRPKAPNIVAAKVLAVWRRTLLSRPQSSQEHPAAHEGRIFLLGNWRFVVGDRTVMSHDGKSIRLSITEHAFLRHICVVEDHLINSDILNLEVLGRDREGVHVRLDNFVSRLKNKFHDSLEILQQGRTGFYRLHGIKELTPAA